MSHSSLKPLSVNNISTAARMLRASLAVISIFIISNPLINNPLHQLGKRKNGKQTFPVHLPF